MDRDSPDWRHVRRAHNSAFCRQLIYYPSLQAIEQQSRQLCGTACHHCGKTCTLLSHGYIRKKQHGGPAAGRQARMQARLPNWRSMAHQPPLPATAAPSSPPRYRHRSVLRTTLAASAGEHDGQCLCRALQRRRQQAFM